mmetsp:Transcript_22799/g.34215  ORF Transcript_22799/g.34215 Transcript_22799/m.34215 type:complete len:252 (-) Transcript_22799:595-1350(-)
MIVTLDAVDDTLLHGNCLFGVLSSSTLSGKHNSIRSIIDSSGYITCLRTRWGRRLNHTFKHLRCDDHRLTLFATRIDDLFLQQRNIFRSTFNTQITTSNHNSITQIYNPFQRITNETGRFLDLRHDGRTERTFRQPLIDERMNFLNIFRTLHETQRNPINSNFEHVLEIRSVFFRQRTNFKNRIRGIDSLAVADLPGNIDASDEESFSFFHNRQFHLSIIHKQNVSNFTRCNNFRVGKHHTSIITTATIQI